ncbi:RagB/SusD family nutrient uptake outer membrane protein [Reichenbachiella agariperforans]|uniref:RagB/SusD family nutrient uptake outer membrane protein n=1 Tax=Reichenbachiella agariperforans TaxID=156994 RepID=UPI001C0844BE|nr:RagB/SusD family nutrient uptake outer membrane protein [Reichenbachiella agariperforans]MBU2914938.1 RagB/SusD family nutrient uptake outer membrane protein [Reichenbachiella agariperforans]
MKIRYYIFILFGLLMANSCDLTEEPYGFYSEDNFYKSEADAESAVSYAYDALTYLEYSRGVFMLGDMPTDEVGPKTDEGADAQALNNWTVDNFSNNRSLYNYFKYAYIAINRTNGILEAIPASDIPTDAQKRYLGEAYFLRAWNYFNLVRNFGLVPVHKELVAELGQTAAPMAQDLDELYDLIIGDCRRAIELLEVLPALGRADEVSAQALAAKAYIYMASSKASSVPLYTDLALDAATLYDSAAYFSGQVLNDQATYGFDPDLMHIYDVESPRGPEHIFLMSMDRTGAIEGDYSKISKLFIPYISGGDIYIDNGDGTYDKSHDGWSVFQTKETFYNTYDGADARGQVLLVDAVYDENGVESAAFPGAIPYRFCRKYVDPQFIADKTSTRPFLIRYTDIALTYAEAVGPTAEAYDLVNYVRNRAGLGDLPAGLSVVDFRDRIIEERSWELAFEGNRLYDLRRINKVTEMVDEAAGITDEEAAFYPIPQLEIDLNQGL